MSPPPFDPFDHPASRLALEVFRLNGALIGTGDRLVAPLGLTSARWQVLGAIAQAPEGLPTADIARAMGLTRQSVQRVVDDLAREEMLAFAPNPRHKRAKLVRLTKKGARAFEAASALWAPLAQSILKEATAEGISAACAVLRQMREQLAALTPSPAGDGQDARHASGDASGAAS